MIDRPPLLEVDDLVVRLSSPAVAEATVVDGVTFTLGHGEALGLVGQSGCGKSTLARTLVGLHPVCSGRIRLCGQPLPARPDRAERLQLSRRVQMVFQDASGALSPRRTVEEILREPMDVHGVGDRTARLRRASELLSWVGLSPDMLRRFPHELSGGQRQRLGLARSLILEPDVLIADEPVSALDVLVQARILDLFERVRAELGTAIVFISHDLAVVSSLCSRIAVMDRGRIVEAGTAYQVSRHPHHPCSQSLLAAVPALQRPP